MSDDFTKKVEEAINTTGYPVELFVLEILRNHEHITMPNQYFYDFEANESRSVDIVVPAFGAYSSGGVNLRLELAIECKKSPKTAWVFFETDTIVQPEYSGQIIDYEQIVRGKYQKMSRLWEFNDSLNLHYGEKKKLENIARNYQVVRVGEKDLDDSTRKTKAKDTIFEAVNQVLKYVLYTISGIEKISVNRWFVDSPSAFFAIFYPIIVYDGPLFNGYLDNNEIKLQGRDHIVLETQFKMERVEKPKKFYIDIIKKEKFEELLIKLEKEREQIADHIDCNKKEFYEHAKRLKVLLPRLTEVNKKSNKT